ncbi:transcription factor TFIIIB component B'' homolog Bdp1 [Calliopsis andreniformis]|uniref:transcription factor TFIIIB component B'' homolog Bdp1 n=1 Tax=Calliopsis andreniformis TaxID=337506 RepID=UPI003FCDBF46
MRRARIKATVTVPTRRKATQDSSASEATIIESTEENKNTSNDVCTIPKEISENGIDNSKEKQMQLNSTIEEQSQNGKVYLNTQNIDNKHEIKQSSEIPEKKDIVQSVETLNTTPSASTIRSAQSRLGFIRPVPKLDSGGRIRKNSIQGSGASASESEDDSRRINSTNINNATNDLINTAQTVKDISINNNKNNIIKSKIGQKRRMLVSESAKKLAEARKEFQLRHENKTPDRSKLTMYDLIYYNPITNPMKRSKETGVMARKVSDCRSEQLHEDENEDDPSFAMPAPQVKVGSDGQLIIDEQSLVIEQTNTRKGREALAKEAIIDDDNTGSGFYKKRQKSKEWPKWETLKFYKALNTVGTDFLLMQSLFPNRTRQEIKLKFKKEEKVNRNLVEKALAYHQEFDIEMLEKSLAAFEHSEKEYSDNRKKQKRQGSKEKKSGHAERKRKCRLVASSIAEMDASDSEEEQILELEQDENAKISDHYPSLLKRVNKKRKKSKEETKILEESLTEIDNSNSLSSCNSCDSDTEVYHIRPTRSGRLSKVKKLQGPDINTLDNEKSNDDCNDSETVTLSSDNMKISDNLNFDITNNDTENTEACENSVKTIIPNIGNVEPGSLVILSKESPEEPGKSVLQVYMVSSNINTSENLEESITPVNLPPELLATVTTRLSDVESITVKKELE